MRTIYLDSNFMCHAINDGTMQAVETNAFDGLCAGAIECYRYIPAGQSWSRPDGRITPGPFIQAVKESAEIQRQYALDEAQRWGSLGIPQENSFTATSNHVEGEFLSAQGKLYKCVYPIPATCTIVPGTNIVPATMEEYLESIKEG